MYICGMFEIYFEVLKGDIFMYVIVVIRSFFLFNIFKEVSITDVNF